MFDFNLTQEVISYLLVFALVVIDYITGIIAAVVNKRFDSSIMRQGLWHKMVYFIAVLVAFILERLTYQYDLGFVFGDGLVVLVIVWITITEAGSILENLVCINPELAENGFMRIFARREDNERRARAGNQGGRK